MWKYISVHTIFKSLWRSKALVFISVVSLIGIGSIDLIQPIQAQTINKINAKPPKGVLRYKTEFDRRTNYLDKNCVWNNYQQEGLNYRICAMQDIIMSVAMDGPEGDNGPTFYRYNYGGINTFAFRDTGAGTAVIIERGRLVAEVEVGYSAKNTITTRFKAEQRKSLTDRALSSQKDLEAVGNKWLKSSATQP